MLNLAMPCWTISFYMDLQTIRQIFTMKWYQEKVEESNLWEYYIISGVEAFELNGFLRFKLDGRVFLLNCHL